MKFVQGPSIVFTSDYNFLFDDATQTNFCWLYSSVYLWLSLTEPCRVGARNKLRNHGLLDACPWGWACKRLDHKPTIDCNLIVIVN